MTAVAERPAAGHAGIRPVDLRHVPLTDLHESPLNPRTHYDPALLKELAASLEATGQLTPCLVRPRPKGGYELAAGHRRLRAAGLAGLRSLLCVVRALNDQQFLEVLTIENLQRDDLHPLEEAQGFASLMKECHYDVPKIAERIGRSKEYVYARLKLLQLTPEAKKLFLERKFEAGHAVLIARLSPADQTRALKDGIFRDRRGPASVRELQSWVAQNVRLDPTDAELPALFPDGAAALKKAAEQREQVVHITADYQAVQTKGAPRLYISSEWKRADGKANKLSYSSDKPKTCDKAVTGFVALGRGRGESFKVCVDRSCTKHWSVEREPRRSSSKADASYAKRERARLERERRERAAQQANEARWKKATKAVVAATAARVKQLPAGARGPLAEILLREAGERVGRSANAVAAIGRGTSAEDLVRHLAFVLLEDEIKGWGGHREFAKDAKALGINLAKILDEAAPIEKPKAAAPAKKKAKKR